MSGKRIRIVVGCVVVAAAVVAVPIGLRVWQLVAYAQERTAGAEMIGALRDRPPATVSDEAWDHATRWAITAYHNVCFSEEHVTLDELERFTRDARRELSGEVNLRTVDWLWARLAETGPHGQRYVAKFQPQYCAERDRLLGAKGERFEP